VQNPKGVKPESDSPVDGRGHLQTLSQAYILEIRVARTHRLEPRVESMQVSECVVEVVSSGAKNGTTERASPTLSWQIL